MNDNEQNNLKTIQDLLKYIEELKKEQAKLQDEYKKLSVDFNPVPYRDKNLLDRIIPYRYKKFRKSYIYSKRKQRRLNNIDSHILILEKEIEENQLFLYELQHDISKSNSSQINTIEKTTNNSDIEPYIND